MRRVYFRPEFIVQRRMIRIGPSHFFDLVVSQRVNPAAALPDPMFTLAYENDGVQPSLGTQEMTRLQFMAQQAFPFPGKRPLARKIAASRNRGCVPADACTGISLRPS